VTLPRSDVIPGMIDEYHDFVDLLRSLSLEEWEQPSRCDGWRVADVSAHVVGQLTDVTSLRLDGLGTPEVTKRQVDERRGREPGELAEELEAATKAATDMAEGFDDDAFNAPGPQGGGRTLGFGLESLWFDTFLHADDIRSAVGRTGKRGPGIEASVSHLCQELTAQGWGPAVVRLESVKEFEVAGEGTGRQVTGDPMAFILVASGRADPAIIGLDPKVNIYR
jgi:uncharacterized protein (TIGR03083 family)